MILREAAARLYGWMPTVYVDRGIENFNSQVDELQEAGLIHRVLAQIDVTFSNSMIEAFWRSMKHQWLYLNNLDTIESVRRLVEFYVTEHNTRIPHSAFKGQTPAEIYFDAGAAIPDELAQKRRVDRRARFEFNRSVRCGQCPTPSSNDSKDVASACA